MYSLHMYIAGVILCVGVQYIIMCLYMSHCMCAHMSRLLGCTECSMDACCMDACSLALPLTSPLTSPLSPPNASYCVLYTLLTLYIVCQIHACMYMYTITVFIGIQVSLATRTCSHLSFKKHVYSLYVWAMVGWVNLPFCFHKASISMYIHIIYVYIVKNYVYIYI